MINKRFFNLAMRQRVRRTATRIALIVGTLLVLINHWPAIHAGSFSATMLLQIALTYAVPYCVSTYSSVVVLLSQER